MDRAVEVSPLRCEGQVPAFHVPMVSYVELGGRAGRVLVPLVRDRYGSSQPFRDLPARQGLGGETDRRVQQEPGTHAFPLG